MADQFSKMYDVEVVGGDQRQRLAEMLRANALNAPQGQMVSGWYVPPSWSQNLAHLAQTATGVFGGMALDKERKETAARLLREMSEGVPVEPQQTMQNINRIESMAEGQTQQEPQNQLQQIMQGARPQQGEMTPLVSKQPEQPKFRPLTEDEKLGKAMELAQVDPLAAQMWSARDAARQARLLKLEDLAEKRAWEEKQALRDQQFRREMAQYTIGNRPERNLTIMGPGGEPITMPQSQVPVGTPLYTPAAAKAAKERQGQIEGKANVGEQIQGLREQYNVLNQNMAIPSEQNRWGSNLGAKLSSTGVGQWLGQVGGTQSATARDVIRMSRPGLMQSIVKASGMSAKQIDSNAELKLMLDQATDPTAGYEANMKALDNLDKRFGLSPQSQQNQTSSKW